MSNPEGLLREGRPLEALRALESEIREDPGNPLKRLSLFEVLSVQGQWQRAREQLDTFGKLDPAVWPLVWIYRQAVDQEAVRCEVFAGRTSPTIFGEPREWLAMLVQALRFLGDGLVREARELREKALQEAPTSTGSLAGNGFEQTEFEWIADADSRLGPVLECIVDGKYAWVPFESVHAVRIDPPASLRDHVWLPCRLDLTGRGESSVLIPTRYPGSEENDDDLIRMSRKTDWVAREEDLYQGMGQRILATNIGEFALMDIREVVLGENGRNDDRPKSDPVS